MKARTVNVGLTGRAYDIHIGSGLIARLTDHLPAAFNGRPAFIITDAHVAPHILQPLKAQWPGPSFELVLPAGENTKSFDNLYFILSWLLGNGAQRDAVVIAAGGGVVGDIAGLAAGLALRGLDYIQVPTSLLAQVDSAVGGKTAINMPQGKNMAGLFHQPVLVLSDTDILSSLPDREMRAGYAEILKYALIKDAPFFAWLEENGDALLRRDKAALTHAIALSCQHKAEIVAQDERDKDMRMLLNLGHSFAHAFEMLTGYDGRILHGEAVALGLVLAAEFSQALGLCQDAEKVRTHIAARGLPVRWQESLSSVTATDILAAMKYDKKNMAGKMKLILLRGIGQAFIADAMDEDALRAFLNEAG